ncbi:hypothetical protein KEJ51_03440 [Candidatus Bathyarchaeota archaeon]|nr:hypothetical protein [Candidatus Bathyarchaeota archaeon]MBS7629099.1 hypothetical protein [Candidatus Bathyarchaeota archaeon]
MVFQNLTKLLIQVVVSVIILSPILWVVGRAIVGGRRARFSDALWIVALGTIINSFVGAYVHGILGFIATLILWLALIKHFFDAGWGTAIIIAVVAIIVLGIVALILAFLGLAFISGIGVMKGIL